MPSGSTSRPGHWLPGAARPAPIGCLRATRLYIKERSRGRARLNWRGKRRASARRRRRAAAARGAGRLSRPLARDAPGPSGRHGTRGAAHRPGEYQQPGPARDARGGKLCQRGGALVRAEKKSWEPAGAGGGEEPPRGEGSGACLDRRLGGLRKPGTLGHSGQTETALRRQRGRLR